MLQAPFQVDGYNKYRLNRDWDIIRNYSFFKNNLLKKTINYSFFFFPEISKEF